MPSGNLSLLEIVSLGYRSFPFELFKQITGMMVLVTTLLLTFTKFQSIFSSMLDARGTRAQRGERSGLDLLGTNIKDTLADFLTIN